MAIIEANIKLLQSERLNDDSDGGGFMTGTVIADGVENNLFPDVSDADRVYGRVQIRKVYASVTSADSDTYLGAHMILDEPPGDPAVTTLFVARQGNAQVRSDLEAAFRSSGYRIATTETPRQVLFKGSTSSSSSAGGSATPPGYGFATGKTDNTGLLIL